MNIEIKIILCFVATVLFVVFAIREIKWANSIERKCKNIERFCETEKKKGGAE